ncbi:unnamed protein product, partial [Effrenium voratum]
SNISSTSSASGRHNVVRAMVGRELACSEEGFQRRQDERMEQVRQIASLTEQVAQQNADIHAMATELTVGRLNIAELQKELDKANTPKRARKELDKVPQADTSKKTRKEK